MQDDAPLKKANRSLTRQLWIFAAGSFAFGFALVPLYNVHLRCDRLRRSQQAGESQHRDRRRRMKIAW